jgi:hypothetical protein
LKTLTPPSARVMRERCALPDPREDHDVLDDGDRIVDRDVLDDAVCDVVERLEVKLRLTAASDLQRRSDARGRPGATRLR